MSDFTQVPRRTTDPSVGPDRLLATPSDVGLRNDEVFGLFDLSGGPDDIQVVDGPASPPQGFFEVLAEGTGSERDEFRIGLQNIAGPDASLEIELTNLDVRIMARARFARRGLSTRRFVNQLGELAEAVGVSVEVTSPPNTSVRFKPGSITFQPGSITFQPGSITFQPGSITFQPGTIVPRPIAAPGAEISRVQQVRWDAAMRYPDRPKPITIAVLDTGIDARAGTAHPLFAGHNAADPLGGSPDLEIEPRRGVVDSVYGHGTHVAGIAALRAPLASINHESVRRATGVADSFELARDIGDIARADIVVFSFATSAPSEDDVPVLRAVVRELLSQGKVVVAAAGTEFDLAQPGDGLYPADFDEDALRDAGPDGELPGRLISVAAVDSTGAPMHGSRDGSGAQNQVSSYGVGIASAFPSGTVQWGSNGPTLSYDGWARWTGTSMAAPRVAGAIAERFQSSNATTVTEATAMVIADQIVVAGADAPGIVA